jgi:hypothetical protein
MQRNHTILFSVFAIVTALALAGCSAGTQTATQATAAVDQTATSQTAAEATYVQVQSIDGNSITALVGTMAQGMAQPSGDNQQGNSTQQQGTPPDQPSSGGKQQQGTPPDQPSSGGKQQQGTLPEKSSDNNGGTQPQGTPPEQPTGDGNGSQPQGGQPGGMGFTAGTETITFTVSDATAIAAQTGPQDQTTNTTVLTLADIAVGDVLAITLSSDNIAQTIVVQQAGQPGGNGQTGGQPGGNFGGSGTVTNGTSANTINADTTVSNQTYTSSGDDENALRIDGATATLSGITVNKTGGASSNTEDGDFYGQNAGLLALNGATATISGATVTTDAVNGNGVFSYGEGTTVNVSDSVIRTSRNNSGGIQTTCGATMNATNLDVQTEGASSAAIRSDRGGGTVTVDGGTYVTNGTGSPAVYSTANISVSNATLTANASEAIVIEGKNSVALNNVTLSGSMQASTDANENIHNIMLYQSMSGDAEVGQSSFSATGGSILAKAGDMFYVTNTTCAISLENVALSLANDVLLNVTGNSNSRGWGTAGANGGTCSFTATNQQLSGNILVDSISSLDFSLANGSVFTGAINTSGAAGTVNVTLASGTSWVLTGDSYITSFTGDASQITTNGHSVFVNGTAITK